MTQRALVVAALAIAPATAFAGRKDDAKAHVAKATRAHTDGRFDDARVELEAAYALDPRPDLLYALGQVHAKLGNCVEAKRYFKRFVAGQSDPQIARIVDQAIAACKPATVPEPQPPSPSVSERIPEPDRPPADRPPEDSSPPSSGPPSDRPARPSSPPPSTDLPPPGSPPAQDRLSAATRHPSPFARTRTARAEAAPRRPWYTDALGDALVLGGVAATVVGLVEYRSALSDLDAAEDHASTTSLARYHELVDDARGKRTTSIVLVGAGGALIAAGIVRYVLREDRTEVRTVGVAPARGGGVVTYEGSF
jgi:tetratricopeptide (TPR) repeat protein